MKTKKLIATLSAFTLAATLTVPAFAAGTTVQENGHAMHQTVLELNGKKAYTAYTFAARDVNDGIETTFIPIWYVMQIMNKAGVTAQWNGNTHVLTLSGKSTSLSIHDKRGNASIVLNRKTVESGVPSFAVIDPNSKQKTTFFGLYYAQQMLKSLGFNNTWNGTNHTWTMSLSTSGGSSSNSLTFKVHDGGTGSSKGAGTTYGAGTIG